MSQFKTQDEYGREIFINYCDKQQWCTYNKSSKDEYSPWDVSYTSGSTKIIGEIKMRTYDSNAFKDWMLQSSKLNDLKSVRSDVIDKLEDSEPINIQYINIFRDDRIIIWDIGEINEVGTVLDMNKTTMDNNNNEKVGKELLFLYTNSSIINDKLK